MYFPVNIANFFKNTYFEKHLRMAAPKAINRVARYRMFLTRRCLLLELYFRLEMHVGNAYKLITSFV